MLIGPYTYVQAYQGVPTTFDKRNIIIIIMLFMHEHASSFI